MLNDNKSGQIKKEVNLPYEVNFLLILQFLREKINAESLGRVNLKMKVSKKYEI